MGLTKKNPVVDTKYIGIKRRGSKHTTTKVMMHSG
jgi:hypothetical protein